MNPMTISDPTMMLQQQSLYTALKNVFNRMKVLLCFFVTGSVRLIVYDVIWKNWVIPVTYIGLD